MQKKTGWRKGSREQSGNGEEFCAPLSLFDERGKEQGWSESEVMEKKAKSRERSQQSA